MKIRTSFVSNSSSSSFVIIAKPAVVDNLMKIESKPVQYLLKEFFYGGEKIVLDDNTYELFQFIVESDSLYSNDFDYDEASEKFYEFIETLKKNGCVVKSNYQ